MTHPMTLPIKQMAACMALALAALAMPAGAASPAHDAILDQGIEAEEEGRWNDAVAVYRAELQRNPQRVDLWRRLADIEAQLKHPAEAAKALEQAAQLQPKDAAVWFSLSQAHAVAGDKQGAYKAAGRALELAPDNLEYLRARGDLAMWVDDRAEAGAIQRRILALTPNDDKALLALARIDSWTGASDASVAGYRAYLKRQPNDKTALIELIKVEGWRGNYADALDLLDDYRQRFGEDRTWREQRARALAWVGKPTPALATAAELLKEDAKNSDALTTRIVALQADQRPREALAELDRLATLIPPGKELADLTRFVKTPLRSSITLAGDFSKDSDEVRIQRWTLAGEYVMNPETRLIMGLGWQPLKANPGSGLENSDGSERARYRSGWLGVKHRFSPGVAGDVEVGAASVDGNGNFGTYRAGLEFRPTDEWWLRPELARDLFAVSPRAASVGVKREMFRLSGRWTPDARWIADATAAYADLSDDNRYWELGIAPRRAILRAEKWNMDLGVSARWFGYDKDLNNGYYDPSLYQRYAVTHFTYWKRDDNNGVSLALSLGVQKDNTMDNFKFGGDAVVEGYFGIWDDWFLRAHTSLLHNVRGTTGAYRGYDVGFALTRRF